jgi:hypothetical protein
MSSRHLLTHNTFAAVAPVGADNISTCRCMHLHYNTFTVVSLVDTKNISAGSCMHLQTYNTFSALGTCLYKNIKYLSENNTLAAVAPVGTHNISDSSYMEWFLSE